MQTVAENGNKPGSIAAFAKTFNFDEKLFYKHFNTFRELEQAIYKSFFDQTLQMLKQLEEYDNFSARNKLISFYYTFFELLTANRSFVLANLKGQKRSLKSLKGLKRLRKALDYYIDTLKIETINLNIDSLNNLQLKILEQTAWLQFLAILKFWINDTSDAFEKTDILIEKSINTGFDLINVQPINSAIDLAKFLYNERIKK